MLVNFLSCFSNEFDRKWLSRNLITFGYIFSSTCTKGKLMRKGKFTLQKNLAKSHVSSRVVQCEADCNSSSCMEHVCDDVYQAQSLEGKGRIKKNKTSKYKRSSAVRATVTPHNFGRSIGTT